MIFLRNRTALAVSAALAAAQPALADHDHHHLETVEVYGQAIPATITSVDSSSMAPGRETGDSLRDLLGVSGSRMGGHGIDPTIRGLSQTQLNVLLDGAYVHGGCPNRMDPPTSYATTTAFEEVTVIRGTQTLAYGGGGPGGTILFKRQTERFSEDENIRGRLTGSWRGNSNTRDLGADVTIGGRDGFVRIIGNRVDSGNYEDGNGATVRAAYEERGSNIILGYTPSDSTRFELSWDRQETLDSLFPGAGMDSPESLNDTVRVRAEIAELGVFNNVNAELYRSEVDHVMDNYSLRPNMGMKMRAPSESDTTGGRITAEIASDFGLIKVGVDGQYNDRDARRFNDTSGIAMLNSVLWPEVSIDQTGVFTEIGHQLTPELWLLGGVRYDYVTSEAGKTELDPMGMLMSPEQLYAIYYGSTDTKRTDHNIGALLRAEYRPAGSDTLWYAGFARSVRTPDATERYLASNAMMPSGRWVGNPDINPEAHHQLEVGSLSRWEGITLDVSLFVNNVNDYVLRDRFVAPMNNASVYRNVDAQLIGGEAKLSWAVSDALALEAGAAYVHAENTTDDRAIHQIPPLEGYARATWTTGKLAAGAELQAAATQTRVDLTSSTGIAGQGLDVRETAGWGVTNLFASYQVQEGIMLEAGIDNVFDKGYSQHLNRGNAFDPTQIQVTEPGRSAWVSMTVEL